MTVRLKLIAMYADDLAVVSAHCQDAVLKIADLAYQARAKRFVLTMNRFVWDGSSSAGTLERRKAVLHFERVAKVALQGIDRLAKDTVLELLAITFAATNLPGGVVELAFAGGATVHLEVECIEAQLTDLDAAWEASSRPHHKL